MTSILTMLKDNKELVQLIVAIMGLVTAMVSRKRVILHQGIPSGADSDLSVGASQRNELDAGAASEPSAADTDELLRKIRRCFTFVGCAYALLLIASTVMLSVAHDRVGAWREYMYYMYFLLTIVPGLPLPFILEYALKYGASAKRKGKLKFVLLTILGILVCFAIIVSSSALFSQQAFR